MPFQDLDPHELVTAVDGEAVLHDEALVGFEAEWPLECHSGLTLSCSV